MEWIVISQLTEECLPVVVGDSFDGGVTVRAAVVCNEITDISHLKLIQKNYTHFKKI